MSDAFAELNFFSSFACSCACTCTQARESVAIEGEGRKWGETKAGLSRGCGRNGRLLVMGVPAFGLRESMTVDGSLRYDTGMVDEPTVMGYFFLFF